MSPKTLLPTIFVSLLIATPLALANTQVYTVDFTDPAYSGYTGTGPSGQPCEAMDWKGVNAAKGTAPQYPFHGHPDWIGYAEQTDYHFARATRDDLAYSGICTTSLPYVSFFELLARYHGIIDPQSPTGITFTWHPDTLHTYALLTTANLNGGCDLYLQGGLVTSSPLDPVTGECILALPSMSSWADFEIYAWATINAPAYLAAVANSPVNVIDTTLTIEADIASGHADQLYASLNM